MAHTLYTSIQLTMLTLLTDNPSSGVGRAQLQTDKLCLSWAGHGGHGRVLKLRGHEGVLLQTLHVFHLLQDEKKVVKKMQYY